MLRPQPPTASPLDGSLGESADYRPLKDQVGQHDGERPDHRAGRQLPPLGGEVRQRECLKPHRIGGSDTDESKVRARMNSLKVVTKLIMKMTARAGRVTGMMMRQKIVHGEAPSTRADSSSDTGTESMKPFMRNVLTPMAPPR